MQDDLNSGIRFNDDILARCKGQSSGIIGMTAKAYEAQGEMWRLQMEINLDRCIQLNDELLTLCKKLNGKRWLGRRGIVRMTAKIIEALSYYQQISYCLVRMGGQHDKGDAQG